MNPAALAILIDAINKADAEGDYERAHSTTDKMLALFIECLANREVERPEACARVIHAHLSLVESENRPRPCA